MRVAFLGLGLIGGSVALALRRRAPEWPLVAWTPDGRGPAAAAQAGTIDAAAPTLAEAIAGADLVVLAAPPLAALDLVAVLAPSAAELVARGAVVTDVVSTKAAITDAARAAGLPFVGGHPMAGRDVSGFAHADAEVFAGRPWVVTESVGGADPAPVRTLAEACGARVVELPASDHDDLVAAISALPLLSSAALVESVLGPAGAPDPSDRDALLALAATGWRDTTRLARGDAAMGAGIAATNAPAIVARLHAYRDALDGWLALLEAEPVDAGAVERRLAAARARLEEAP